MKNLLSKFLDFFKVPVQSVDEKPTEIELAKESFISKKIEVVKNKYFELKQKVIQVPDKIKKIDFKNLHNDFIDFFKVQETQDESIDFENEIEREDFTTTKNEVISYKDLQLDKLTTIVLENILAIESEDAKSVQRKNKAYLNTAEKAKDRMKYRAIYLRMKEIYNKYKSEFITEITTFDSEKEEDRLKIECITDLVNKVKCAEIETGIELSSENIRLVAVNIWVDFKDKDFALIKYKAERYSKLIYKAYVKEKFCEAKKEEVVGATLPDEASALTGILTKMKKM